MLFRVDSSVYNASMAYIIIIEVSSNLWPRPIYLFLFAVFSLFRILAMMVVRVGKMHGPFVEIAQLVT